MNIHIFCILCIICMLLFKKSQQYNNDYYWNKKFANLILWKNICMICSIRLCIERNKVDKLSCSYFHTNFFYNAYVYIHTDISNHFNVWALFFFSREETVIEWTSDCKIEKKNQSLNSFSPHNNDRNIIWGKCYFAMKFVISSTIFHKTEGRLNTLDNLLLYSLTHSLENDSLFAEPAINDVGAEIQC